MELELKTQILELKTPKYQHFGIEHTDSSHFMHTCIHKFNSIAMISQLFVLLFLRPKQCVDMSACIY